MAQRVVVVVVVVVGRSGEKRTWENPSRRDSSIRGAHKVVGTHLLSEALSSSTVSHANRASGEAEPNFLAAATAAATACVTSGRDVVEDMRSADDADDTNVLGP
jgi:hypothetical protein